jgi:hypothetical protein
VSAKIGVYGDIAQTYLIRRVNGFSLQRQNELYSNNGQVGFRGFERVDGRIRNATRRASCRCRRRRREGGNTRWLRRRTRSRKARRSALRCAVDDGGDSVAG